MSLIADRELTALLVAAILAGCSGVATSEDAAEDLGAAEGVSAADRTGVAQSGIVNGEVTEQYPAVGVLTLRRSRCEQLPDTALCTVTLVADKWVLTAGHCVADYRERMLSVRFGSELGDAGALEYPVVRHILHPQYDETSSDHDVALLLLSEAPDISPMTLSDVPLDDSFIGVPIVLLGFGESGNGDSDGLKRMGLGQIEQILPRTFRYLPMPAVTCRGDSGGPALVVEQGAARLVGITSAGDAACQSHGIDVRVDTLLHDFIEPALEQLDPPPAPSPEAAALCEQSCTDDSDCPGQLLCLADEQGIGRCSHPQLEAGNFAQACSADTQCASGLCAPFADSCACYTPCAGSDEPPAPAGPAKPGAGDDSAAEPLSAPGCSVGPGAAGLSDAAGSHAGDGTAGGWLALLGVGWMLRRRD